MKLIYLGIFLFKIIEDALATLRLIVVSNGKKILGAILQFVCTIIWIILTGTVLIDFMDDFGKVVSFSFGSLFGSFLGSVLEEQIALGTNSFIVKVKNNSSFLINELKKNNYYFINLSNNTVMITAPRKKSNDVIRVIKRIDNNAFIVSEKIKIFSD